MTPRVLDPPTSRCPLFMHKDPLSSQQTPATRSSPIPEQVAGTVLTCPFSLQVTGAGQGKVPRKRLQPTPLLQEGQPRLRPLLPQALAGVLDGVCSRIWGSILI